MLAPLALTMCMRSPAAFNVRTVHASPVHTGHEIRVACILTRNPAKNQPSRAGGSNCSIWRAGSHSLPWRATISPGTSSSSAIRHAELPRLAAGSFMRAASPPASCFWSASAWSSPISMEFAGRASGNGWRWSPVRRRAISLATYIFAPNSFIFFGILHEIALASVIGPGVPALAAAADARSGCGCNRPSPILPSTGLRSPRALVGWTVRR